jgi:PRTRC genetic system protein D
MRPDLFNYMLPTLPSRTIDFLMLGLPLTTLNRHSEALSNRYIGEHTINLKGGTITVSNCAVYPQPLGGYAAYLQRPLARHTAAPLALIVDIGYNTVDWLTCEGMVANPTQASAVERGMNAYLREVAKSIIKTANVDGSESAIVRRLDQQMIKGGEFSLIDRSPGGRRRRILRCMWRGADAEEGLLQQPREQLQAGEAPTPQISPDESADSNAHDQSSFGQPIASTGLFIVPTAMRSKNDR